MAAIAAAFVIDQVRRPWWVGQDFHTYEAAARVGLQYGWAHIYDQDRIDLVQRQLAPWLWTQPYLSPPPVAWLAAFLAPLPYSAAFDLWVILSLAALVFGLGWSTPYRGPARAIAVGVALAPWWVFHALLVGQVVPLIAAGVLVSWRLAREKHDVAAGIVLAVVLLKPNTALLAPVALLVAGRFRIFAAWLVASGVLVVASLLAIGPHGAASYIGELGHLPPNATALTLYGTLGLSGVAAAVVRVVIVLAALITASRFRASVGLALAVGVLASMVTAPYLHDNDLCLVVAAGWIVWSERDIPVLRALVAAMWLLALPFVAAAGLGPPLDRWLLLELLLLIALAVVAWTGPRLPVSMKLLTASGDARKQAPA